MFIGMYPGYQEEKKGKPFAGRSGKLLREVLTDVGFKEEELYFSNILKCRLKDEKGEQREPTSQEMKLCGKFCLEEIKDNQPKLVVLMGDTPLKYFFNRSPLSKYRGMALSKGDYQFFITYNPAYISRQKEDSEDTKFWKRDFETVFRLFKGLKSPKDENIEKVVCCSYEDMDRCFDRLLSGADRYVLDIESWAPGKSKEKKALDPWAPGFIVSMISFSFYSNEKWNVFCVPLEHPESKLNLETTLKILKSNFEKLKDRKIKLIGQNIKWDLKVLEKHFGLVVEPLYFDTMVTHSLLVGKKSGHSLERMSIDYLGADSYKEILRQQLNSGELAPLSGLANMNMDDCINTLKLEPIFEKRLKTMAEEQRRFNHNGYGWDVWRYHNEIIIPGMKVLKKAELRGMPADLYYVKDLESQLGEEIQSIKGKIFSYPEFVNHQELKLTSPYDLNEILFNLFKFNPSGGRKNKVGYSVDKEALDNLSKVYQHPILNDLQELKLLTKLQNTYVTPYIKEHIKSDGRVHGTFNLHISMTGRLSMEDPNLQNLPVRIGDLILRMFKVADGWYILYADFSQMELRVVSAYAKDLKMIEAWEKNVDIHLQTASEVYGVPLDQVTAKQRQDAKSINFGIIYGMTAEGLAEALGIDVEEASKYLEAYLDTYSGIRGYMADRIREYKDNGYVETLFKRRIYISGRDESHNERRAINSPIQGTASDINQLAAIEIDKIIESRKMRMGLMDLIHDSQVYEVPEDELEEAKKIVKGTMEGVQLEFMRGIPLKVDIGVGKTLGDAKV